MLAVRITSLTSAPGCPAPLPKKSNKYSSLLQAFFSSESFVFVFESVFEYRNRTRKSGLRQVSYARDNV